jgi:hypothetical protein
LPPASSVRMSCTNPRKPSMKLHLSSSPSQIILASLAIAASIGLSAAAQSPTDSAAPAQAKPGNMVVQPSFEQAAVLPDAPIAFDLRASSSLAAIDPAAKAGPAATNGLGSTTAEASHTQKYIEPGQIAPTLSGNDKVLLGVRDAFSLFSAAGWVIGAGYEQLINGSPNYGTDRGAFGQRLGAGAIRDITEGVFSDSIMSPLFHEDARYYRLGPTHNFFARAVYAATRPIITRTDGGHTSPNLGLILGNAGGSALTNVYYPQLNRGFTQTAETFGGSIGGSALGFLVSEFYDDVFHPHRNR